jgi:N-acetylglucosaminyldiphosphoundecaprenol N-acetyl-beta-D-mannosaminyltransferase
MGVDQVDMASPRFSLDAWGGACRFCASLTGQKKIGPERLLDAGQSLYICADCAGLYLAPDLTPASLNQFYISVYRNLFVFEASRRYDTKFYSKNLFGQYGELRAAVLEKLVPHGGRVFEMGSGCGAFLGALARRRPDIKLYASELDLKVRKAMLGEARVTFLDRKEQKDDLIAGIGQGPGPTLKELSGAGPFDLVVAFHALEHLRDPGNFLRASRDVLAPGGQIVMEVPDADADWGAWNFVHPAHLSYFTVRSISRLAMRSGLRLVAVGSRPWGLEETNLLLHAEAADVVADVPQAPENEVRASYEHAKGYFDRWGVKSAFRNNLKNAGISLLGPATVGMWQRVRFRRKMLPRFEKVMSETVTLLPSSSEGR